MPRRRKRLPALALSVRDTVVPVVTVSGPIVIGITLPVISQTFPLQQLYALSMAQRGGTGAVAPNNARFWQKPVYPTAIPARTVATVGALQNAINGANAGESFWLQNGNQGGNLNISKAVHIYAQTKGGVRWTNGAVTINGNGASFMGCVWRDQDNNNTIIEANGADALIAYCKVMRLTRTTTGNMALIRLNGDRGRLTQTDLIANKGATGDVRIGLGTTGLARYCRFDHNLSRDKWDVQGQVSGDLDNQVLQVSQGNRDINFFTLIDNNYVYRWQNNNGVKTVNESEIFTLKASSCFVAQNAFVECAGSLSLRNTAFDDIYANYFIGPAPESGGVAVQGPNHRIIANYFRDLNLTATVNQGATFRMIAGDAYVLTADNYPADDCRVLFNTVFNCNRPFVFTNSVGNAVPPRNNRIYNNAVDKNSATGLITIPNNPQDVGTIYDGNTFEPAIDNDGRPLGGTTNIIAAPQFTSVGGYMTPTNGGNCFANAFNAYTDKNIVICDALGNPMPATNTHRGCFQPGFTPVNDPVAAILAAAGADA